MLEVDRTGGAHDGNVYVCWSRFTGVGGQNKIVLQPLDGLRCDLLPADRDLAFERGSSRPGLRHRHRGRRRRLRDVPHASREPELVAERARVRPIDRRWRVASPTLAADPQHRRRTPRPTRPATAATARSCAPTGFVFHRVPLEPRVDGRPDRRAADGVYLTYNAIDPDSIEASEQRRTPRPAAAWWASPWSTWSSHDGRRRDLERSGGRRSGRAGPPVLPGHRRPRRRRSPSSGRTTATDDAYDVQLPLGNTLDAQDRPVSSGGRSDRSTTFAASLDGRSTCLRRRSPSRSRAMGHQSSTRCSAAATSRSRATTTGSRSPSETTAALVRLHVVDRQPRRGARGRTRARRRAGRLRRRLRRAPMPRRPARAPRDCSIRRCRWPGATRRSAVTTAATRAASTRTSSASRSRRRGVRPAPQTLASRGRFPGAPSLATRFLRPGSRRLMRILSAHVGVPARRRGRGVRLRRGARPAVRPATANPPGDVVRRARDVRGRVPRGRRGRGGRLEPDPLRGLLDPRRGAERSPAGRR